MKNTSLTTPLIVYWSPFTTVQNQYNQVLLDLKPISFRSYVVNNKAIDPKIPTPNPKTPYPLENNGYHTCSAMHELAKNTFIIKAPFSAEIHLDDNGSIKDSYFSGWFIPRIGSFNNSFCVDFDLPYLFFSEEEVNMQLTPPYMTKTLQQEYGFPAAVEFDISQWFRPLIITYQLWEEVNSFKIKENEPLIYITFDTNRPIILKQFNLTENLVNQATACMRYKRIRPFEPLKSLYSTFKATKMNQLILKEIKDNLIDL